MKQYECELTEGILVFIKKEGTANKMKEKYPARVCDSNSCSLVKKYGETCGVKKSSSSKEIPFLLKNNDQIYCTAYVLAFILDYNSPTRW